jgi:hypothetical protein
MQRTAEPARVGLPRQLNGVVAGPLGIVGDERPQQRVDLPRPLQCLLEQHQGGQFPGADLLRSSMNAHRPVTMTTSPVRAIDVLAGTLFPIV